MIGVAIATAFSEIEQTSMNATSVLFFLCQQMMVRSDHHVYVCVCAHRGCIFLILKIMYVRTLGDKLCLHNKNKNKVCCEPHIISSKYQPQQTNKPVVRLMARYTVEPVDMVLFISVSTVAMQSSV
jgi:hypothetical protein